MRARAHGRLCARLRYGARVRSRWLTCARRTTHTHTRTHTQAESVAAASGRPAYMISLYRHGRSVTPLARDVLRGSSALVGYPPATFFGAQAFYLSAAAVERLEVRARAQADVCARACPCAGPERTRARTHVHI